jgi:uncharacterized protein YjeT (DUF2065 family)
MHLRGSPQLPFALRFSLTVIQSSLVDVLELMGLVIAPAAFMRQLPDADHRTTVGVLLAVGAALLGATWYGALPAAARQLALPAATCAGGSCCRRFTCCGC